MKLGRNVRPLVVSCLILLGGCADRVPRNLLGCYYSDSAPSFKIYERHIIFRQNGIKVSDYSYHIGGFSETIEPASSIRLVKGHGSNKFEITDGQRQIFLFDFKNKNVLTMLSSDGAPVTWTHKACS